MISLKKILPKSIRRNFRYALCFMPDSAYIKLFYFCATGRRLDLKYPKGFNEKLNWLKLHDKHEEYNQYVDKYAVRSIIAKELGEDCLFPLLGKWKSFDEISFDNLPNEFVLKCNHDSGSAKIIRDKQLLTDADKTKLRNFYNNRLSKDYYYASREYSYKGIENRYIIAEELMKDHEHPENGIEDYKFYCFNGKPMIMLMVSDRETDCRFDFYDMEFNHLDIVKRHPNSESVIIKPLLFDRMKEIATKLSKGMRFVRIDLYQLNGKVYFGEYTFFPGGGFELFKPDYWEKRLGDWIELPELNTVEGHM